PHLDRFAFDFNRGNSFAAGCPRQVGKNDRMAKLNPSPRDPYFRPVGAPRPAQTPKGVAIVKAFLEGNTCVVGLQWGDEGKGKIVDFLAEDADVVVRYCGGANAGHSVRIGGEKYATHL